jgi:hypothetical protein
MSQLAQVLRKLVKLFDRRYIKRDIFGRFVLKSPFLKVFVDKTALKRSNFYRLRIIKLSVYLQL